MSDSPVVVITGARGNLGGKLVAALKSRCTLRCLDLHGSDAILAVDLAVYEESWAGHFAGADIVLHFAGEPLPTASWAQVHRGNIVATANVLRAARLHSVRRIVFASTNQIMAGYRFGESKVTTTMAPTPLNPYAVSKLFCEESGRAFSAETGISFLALRIGNIAAGENVPHPGMGIGVWGQQMWLSNRDFVDGVQAAMHVPNMPFAIVNLVSNNPGMRWDIDYTRQILGFSPRDGFRSSASPEDVVEDAAAQRASLVPGQWLDQRFLPLKG